MARTTHTPVNPTHESEALANNPVHDEEETTWIRGRSLDAPPPRPGMAQRWICVSSNGKDDVSNAQTKFREGWVPRDANTVSGFYFKKVSAGEFAGKILVNGMLLCERKKAISERRDRHFNGITQARTEAVNAELEKFNRQNASKAFGPIQSKVVSKRVREVLAQDD
jgi:hypothetical protein